MKKILSLCLVFMLLILGAVPALAAADVAMTLKTDQQTLKPGDQVTVRLEIQAEKACTAFAVMMVYDEKIFEVVEGTCEVPGAALADFDPARGFVAMYLAGNKPQAEVGQVTLQVRPNAPTGETIFTGNTSVKDGNASLEATINALTFQIAGDATQETQQQQGQETNDDPTVQTQPQAPTQTIPSQTQPSDIPQTNDATTGTTQPGGQVTKPVEKENDTLLIAVIAVAAVAVIAVGGYLVLKKKR